jgi:hypothetical protein
MVHDLEESLAIEAARAGGTEGEATTVLRTLPGDTAEYAPGRLRRPRRALITTLALAALGAGLVAYLATRTEQGAGGGAVPGNGGLATVDLASSAATDYDPEGTGGESPEATQNAIDGNPSTFWDTETYRSGLAEIGKRGVGLYVDAGSPIAARRLDLVTPTPGWDAELYAARGDVPDSIGGWTRVGSRNSVDETEQIDLDTAGNDFQYYLVWIVRLPPENRAIISELTLRR